MSDIELTSIEIIQLDANFDSALIKLLYSFIWQEWVITDNPMLFEPEVNAKGAELLPVVNQFANVLNNFPEYDQNLQVIRYLSSNFYCYECWPR